MEDSMSSWADEYLTLCDDCEARESRLSDWERGFVESIRSRLENKIPLTPKQTEMLSNVWERATARG
jgi:hypothetical protein